MLMALLGTLLIDVARPSAPAIPKVHVSVRAQRVSPNVPVIGTGSAYDGRHYGSAPIKRLDFGTGSVYDGGHYGSK